MVNRVKRLMPLCALSLTMFMGGCAKPPEAQNLVGEWTGPDGAQVTLQGNNTFTARGLPFRIFDNPVQSGAPISGSGEWKVAGSRVSGWEVQLAFREEAGVPSRRGVRINVSCDDDSYGLFQWVDEEGGSRYTFTRGLKAK